MWQIILRQNTWNLRVLFVKLIEFCLNYMNRSNIGLSSYNGGIDATGERVKHRAVNCEELDNLLDTVIDMYYSYE